MAIRFYSSGEFIDRVASIGSQQRKAKFLIGSGLVLPTNYDSGVPSSEHFICRIRKALCMRYADRCRNYQEAFETLICVRGQDAAKAVVRDAVLQARNEIPDNMDRLTASELEKLEQDTNGWFTSPGLLAIAALAAHFPESYGRMILTTNFDPLIEIALSKMELPWYSSALQSDGSLRFTKGIGTHVVHLHGHWLYSDTLHTTFQLGQNRRMLVGSLRELLRNSTTIVTGYGGWTDVFMAALSTILAEGGTQMELLWAFYECDESEIATKYNAVLKQLRDAVNSGRVLLYKDIDAHDAFPKIFERATNERPAQDVETFIKRVDLVTSGAVKYASLAGPWGRYSSLGDFPKLLVKFQPTLAAQASLYAVQYLLPRLERWQVASARTPQKYPEVREFLENALDACDNPDCEGGQWNHRLFCMLRRHATVLEHRAEDACGREDSLALRAASYAICATIASHSIHGSFKLSANKETSFPVEVWAAKAVHNCARVLHDDRATLWSYITRRITGGFDHVYFNS